MDQTETKTIKPILEQIIALMNIGDFRVEWNEELRRLSVFIDNEYFIKDQLPPLVENLNHLGQLIAKKIGVSLGCVDVNNYRLERERIITDLARAAARKAIMTKNEVSLPIMNSYERRLIHMELAMHPDIRTESDGEGRSRHVKIKPILE